MAEHFTGRKLNFHWLINHIFYNQRKRHKKQAIKDTLAEWLLLTMRSWDVEALKPQIDVLEKHINDDCPKLLKELGVLLWEVRNQCESTQDALNHAKAIVDCISKYINVLERLEQKQNQNGSTQDQKTIDQNAQEIGVANDEQSAENNQDTIPDAPNSPNPSNSQATDPSDRNDIAASLRSLLDSDGASLPDAIGEKVKALIEKGREKNPEQKVRVATVGRKDCRKLDAGAIQNAIRISTSLKARLQGLLQAQSLMRYLPASPLNLVGKINKNRLHALAVNETKVFLRHTTKQATNTAIHILPHFIWIRQALCGGKWK